MTFFRTHKSYCNASFLHPTPSKIRAVSFYSLCVLCGSDDSYECQTPSELYLCVFSAVNGCQIQEPQRFTEEIHAEDAEKFISIQYPNICFLL